MSCTDLRRLLAEDDPARREPLLEHATGCNECHRWLEQQRAIDSAVMAWRSRTDTPRATLETRIRKAVAEELVGRPLVALPRRSMATSWLAAAAILAAVAILLVARGLLAPAPAVSVAGNLVLEDALEAARAAEREHARALAALEQAVATVLARADAPGTSAREAAVLLSFRGRLASIDDVIAEIQGYLETNPGLASARTVLLAAYVDKTELLREVIALDENRGA